MASLNRVSASSSGASISPERWEFIELCVDIAHSVGVPRSVGEIFGFVFSADGPVSFDDVAGSLLISAGSASYGLRYLRRFGAIKACYVARDRRDFFTAETSLRRLIAGYFSQNITYRLAEVRERLQQIAAALETGRRHPVRSSEDLKSRVEILLAWNGQMGAAMQSVLETLPR